MAHPALTSDHERTKSNTMSERHAQHSHLTMRGTNPVIYVRKAQHSHLTMRGTNTVIYVRKALHLHSTMQGTNPTYMSKGSALTSDHVGTNPIVTSEWICTYIWSCRNQYYNHIINAHPTLTSDHVGTNPTTLSERPNTHIWPCRNTSHNPFRKA